MLSAPRNSVLLCLFSSPRTALWPAVVLVHRKLVCVGKAATSASLLSCQTHKQGKDFYHAEHMLRSWIFMQPHRYFFALPIVFLYLSLLCCFFLCCTPQAFPFHGARLTLQLLCLFIYGKPDQLSPLKVVCRGIRSRKRVKISPTAGWSAPGRGFSLTCSFLPIIFFFLVKTVALRCSIGSTHSLFFLSSSCFSRCGNQYFDRCRYRGLFPRRAIYFAILIVNIRLGWAILGCLFFKKLLTL